jgi:cysteine desulfurase/selenocysteine lyase
MKNSEIIIGNSRSFPVEKIRKDFPLLETKVHGKKLVYLDNAATTQKPKSVIEAVCNFYSSENSNVHRGVHYLSELATAKYEEAREKVGNFLNAGSGREIIFVRGATEAVNLVASSFGRKNIGAGDSVIITGMEHHSNIVPWQMLCEEKEAKLLIAPVNDSGETDIGEYERLFSENIKLAALNHVSNVLGTVNPIKKMIEIAHNHNVPVLVDGAQAVPHIKVDVTELDADFYLFSSHKVFGPTGIGVLYGKESLLELMHP